MSKFFSDSLRSDIKEQMYSLVMIDGDLPDNVRHGSNSCDSFERSSSPKINPEAAQEAIAEFIFHRADGSKLSH